MKSSENKKKQENKKTNNDFSQNHENKRVGDMSRVRARTFTLTRKGLLCHGARGELRHMGLSCFGVYFAFHVLAIWPRRNTTFHMPRHIAF
jgi:hypothetical protein